MIKLYLKTSPNYINKVNEFSVGYFNINGLISDITSLCTITIVQPTYTKLIDTNKIIVNSLNEVETVELKIEYSGETNYVYFTVVQPILNITAANILTLMRRYMPQNVFTDADDALCSNLFKSIADTLFLLYDNSDLTEPQFNSIKDLSNDMYPQNGNNMWERYLSGNNSLYLQSNKSYSKLLELFYQINMNNSNNPYFLALNISKYIYYRLGIQKFVYIGENEINFGTDFILDSGPNLGEVSFSGNINGGTPYSIFIHIIEAEADFNVEFKKELYGFIRRIVKPALYIEIDYDKSFGNFGLTPINPSNNNLTYHTDPNQENSYCIQFSESSPLSQAQGYTGLVQFDKLLSFTLELTPTPGGLNKDGLIHLTTYQITIIPVWDGIPPIINLIPYSDFFIDDENIATLEYINGVQYLNTISAGTFTLQPYCASIMGPSKTYTVS